MSYRLSTKNDLRHLQKGKKRVENVEIPWRPESFHVFPFRLFLPSFVIFYQSSFSGVSIFLDCFFFLSALFFLLKFCLFVAAVVLDVGMKQCAHAPLQSHQWFHCDPPPES